MKTRYVSLLVVASVLVPGTVLADQALLNKNGCMTCHAVEKKLVGPSYRDIANKYRSQTDAADRLAKKIRDGGAGAWGPIPMPAHPHVSETDAKKLAQSVLSIK